MTDDRRADNRRPDNRRPDKQRPTGGAAVGSPAVHNFRRMVIYDRTLALAAEVYGLTRRLPRDEAFGLTSQLRRAAVSVALNIAEGSGASSRREFARFLEIARRSLYEIDAGLQISTRLRLLASEDCRLPAAHTDELAAMITGFKSQLCRSSRT